MKIIALSEGAFTIDSTKKFIPFDPQKDDLQKRTVGSLLVEIQPFLIITSKDILLLDAGLGATQNGEPTIFAQLKEHGIGAAEVTKVLMSHLHKDHAAGLSIIDPVSGLRQLAFPNALYYVQESELNYALSGESPSYQASDVEVLTHSKNVVLLKESNGYIDDYIHFEVTGAHSKYHQVFWIKEADEIIFYGADDAPQLGQMKKRFIAKYDYDGRKCMELRLKWWAEGESNHWTFLFYHDVKTPSFTFK